MADSMMYSEEMFVFLTPDASETFLTPSELIDKLKEVLSNYAKAHQGELPHDLQKLTSADAQAQYLLETHCEFETAPGETVQWYAVRLEK
ncbi:MAG: chlororespiratory reduction protein 7 [Phormidesmis priestleyi]|uniref:Chlororespiratory reduction protein 7 n=1 Tax=Phormidesmis priestleyi TaxID=268141 RepID=A0A2W4XVH5_9CYAN|nr:MAG: chlororespiratory reduction protein 7 [Phormidesmis priestleyi]